MTNYQNDLFYETQKKLNKDRKKKRPGAISNIIHLIEYILIIATLYIISRAIFN